MKNDIEDYDCYLCQIYFDDRRGNQMSFYTHWVGFADAERRIELRAPSKLEYARLAMGWLEHLQGPLLQIRSEIELWPFFIKGGAAAIDAELAEKLISKHLKVSQVTSTGLGAFSSVRDISEALQRAPSKKLRMRILERDNYRCRVCGQSSKTNVNIELHVHHIRPWANQGATTENNLVTLCHTCHGGLDPHWNMKLAEFIEDFEGASKRWQTPPKFQEF
ncbi:MAG: HNH endonuclease [Cypionkella sp.]|uniref:HNH endonuclease n=1 Tax=Cypionkella sp. TaxID=2811411 RepID=UPI002AB81173|nr:HNH endonuclease [Cypionkella sp.]MDZ4309301.1 HNH endonuclease [Cypionkella sp.]